ncbi:SdrD B-like domain-containing protein [Tautonia sociabilis]|uniref:SD-repeat containing protein B domain-containing protein n=1 Tax=Tautonia sociabilis TaxID=2080755 RepID=A0A432MKC5_9BACT|nr:SdrD B-like domain-containing protein [Tautonia sociabilis]RUL87852.1 hypothetical protein TsocGM_09965 [Tautonia sociabilis]
MMPPFRTVAPTPRRRSRNRPLAPEPLETRTLLATISGRTFEDLDGDGVVDPGEAGFAGRSVFIDLDRDGLRGEGDLTAVTDSSGNFRFDGLAPGGYLVRQVPDPGFLFTNPSTGTRGVLLTSPSSVASNQNFGSRLDTRGTGRVTGMLYEDLNENGFREAGEPGLAGLTVFADLNGDSHLDGNEPSTVSDSSGQYSLILPVGSLYQIREDVPSGWALSQPTETFYFAPIFSETTVPGRDFGNIRGGGGGDPGPGATTINGVVFEDLNGNGVRDGVSEPGLAGRTVFIDTDDDGLLDAGEVSTQTAADGSYTLGVDPGTSTVAIVVTPGFEPTSPTSVEVTVGPMQNILGVNFGLRAITGLTISGTVFRDLANFGSRDPDEPGLADFRVYLDINHNQAFDAGEPSVLSQADGGYTLVVTVDPGLYLLRQEPRSGYRLTTPPAGFYLLNLQDGMPVTGQDFGNLRLASSSGSLAALVPPDAEPDALPDATQPLRATDPADEPVPIDPGAGRAAVVPVSSTSLPDADRVDALLGDAPGASVPVWEGGRLRSPIDWDDLLG